MEYLANALRTEPELAMLFGPCAEAGTPSAPLWAFQDEAQSTVPVLAYTVGYAVAIVLLTALGPVIVALTR